MIFSGIQKKTFIVVGIALGVFIVSAGAYGAGIYALLTMRARVLALPIEASALVLQSEKAQAARRILEKTEAEREMLQRFFFTEDEAVSFLGDIEEVARGVGASIELTSAAAQKDGGLLLEAELSGEWESVMRFLALLEL